MGDRDLLERKGQLEELSQYLREAGAGAGKLAFISGEAGAGKSALVEHFAQQAGGSAKVYWGHCDALQTSRVLGAVQEVAAGLARLPGQSAEIEPSREQLFARLLERFSPPNPLSLVILEDIHWADEATLDFLRFIGRRIQRTRCLMIATLRNDELHPNHPLRAVLGDLTGRHTARILVSGLSMQAVEELAADSPRDGREVYNLTGGNPFFVREILSAPIDAVPQTVRDAVLVRLQQCSPAAREVAELASLLPGRTETWLIRDLLGEAGSAADEAVTHGLLRYHEHSLVFRHELGRLAVESAIPGMRAQSLHQNILDCLIAHGADLSQLVHHAAAAQDVKALIEYAPRAAEQAARAGAHREAAAHFATALTHADSLPVLEQGPLFERHAMECDITNQAEAAAESAERALSLWQEAGDVTAQARVFLLMARQHWKAGQKTSVEQNIASAISLLETLPPGRELGMAYSVRAQLAMTRDLVEESVEFGQRALDLATQFNDHGVRSHALNNMGSALVTAGDPQGLKLLEQSLSLAREHGLQAHAGRAYANLVSTAVRLREVALTERYAPEGIEYCETYDVQDCLAYIRAYAAHSALNQGRWVEAVEIATELLADPSLAISQRMPTLVVLALVRARRGDPGVDVLLDEAARLAHSTGEFQRIGPVAAARAEVAWYRGDLKRVASEAAVGLQAAVGHRETWISGELAYWMQCANGSIAVSWDVAEPYKLMLSGDIQAAAATWADLSSPYERALALAAGPEESLLEALTVLEQLRAGPLASIVRQRLRDLGVRSIPRGPRASTRENPAGLTSREIQVLSYLVHGHSNNELARRLHISPKTVDHHVSSILDKLDVCSRTEAVAAAFGLGIVQSIKPKRSAVDRK